MNDTVIDKKSSGLLGKLGKKLALSGLLAGKKTINDNLLEELETLFLTADVGLELTQDIIDAVQQGVARKSLADSTAVYDFIKQYLLDLLTPCVKPLTVATTKENMPFVIMTVGVNGVGKTTTVGKLSSLLGQQGLSVMLAAGDTFRAAAVEQLQKWGERNNIPVIAQATGSDAASVVHDAMQSATAKSIDVLMVDTAGRQHSSTDLMQELVKIRRVINKVDENAPHEVLLVLDAGTGQNALMQLEHFNKAVNVTGIIITKLDGTAKAGIVLAIAKKTGMPIWYIGVGEGVEDLRPFDASEFIDALLES
jgi:fused signal recognition particle receptor